MTLVTTVPWSEVATKSDLEHLRIATKSDLERYATKADLERMARKLTMWTSSMVLGGMGLAFAAGRLL